MTKLLAMMIMIALDIAGEFSLNLRAKSILY